MESQWGIPVVTADTIFRHLECMNIKPWKCVEAPVLLPEYTARNLSDTERRDLRFAPIVEVVGFDNPKDNSVYRGFRTQMKSWATTFVLLPGDLVVIVAEWKHGAEELTLVPPSGVPSKVDNGSMAACAKREFEEETGIALASVEPLAGPNGLPVASRGLTTRFHPFLGIPARIQGRPIFPGPPKLDANEQLELVLMPLTEWLKLIDSGLTNEECAVSITFLALNRLGRLQLK